MYNLKELVKNTTVKFIEYRKGNLWYKVEGTNFEFPVPIEDVGDGIFKDIDKGILFMRYIIKHLENM